MTREKIILPGFAAFLVVFYLSAYAGEMPQYTRTDYPIYDVARFVYTGSENKDSRPDVVVIDKSGAINVLLAGPNTVLGTAIVTETGIKEPKATVADDFNNDGLTDICINDTLFIATGNGQFAALMPLGIDRLQTLASTDMNGDGNKDLIAITMINIAPDMRAAELRTYFGNGDGTFKEPEKTRIVFDEGEVNWMPGVGSEVDDSGTYSIRYVGDLTEDRIPDLVVRHTYIADGWVLYFNWTFIGTSNDGFNKNSLYAPASGYSTKVHDFNGDGMLDIMENGSFYIGNIKGQFLYLWEVETDFFSPVFAVADVNNDGMLDLARIRLASDESESYCKLIIMLGNNMGKNNQSFSEVYEYPVKLPGTFPFYGESKCPLQSYQLNSDGCADFIISSPDSPFSSFIAVILSMPNPVSVNSLDKVRSIFLGQNTPNPFNSSTMIPYFIQTPGIYELAVYDILGRKTMTLLSRFQSKGEHHSVWNGKDDKGVEAASGFYFCVLRQMKGKGMIASKRLLLMK